MKKLSIIILLTFITIFTVVNIASASWYNPLTWGSQNFGSSIFKPSQGGTGIGTATAGDVGKILVVSDDSPFTYSLQTVSGTGDITDGASLGTGLNIFDSKSGSNLRFNSILAGSNITLSTTSDSNTIVISSSGGGGGGGGNFGQAWEIDTDGNLAPTTTINVLIPSNLRFNSAGTAYINYSNPGFVIQTPDNIQLTTTGAPSLTIDSTNGLYIPNDQAYRSLDSGGTAQDILKLDGSNNVLVGNSIYTTKIPNLTSNGFVKTSGSDGTLSVDTNTYLSTASSGTTGWIPYYASSGTELTATSSIFIAPSGNVGIGTTTVTNLTVSNTNLSTFNGGIQLGSTNNVSLGLQNGAAFRTGASGSNFYFDVGNMYVRDGDGSNGNASLRLAGGASIGASYTGTTPPSNGAIIQGNVGIGTTSPANKLQVYTTTDADGIALDAPTGVAQALLFKRDNVTKSAIALSGYSGAWVTGSELNDLIFRTSGVTEKILFRTGGGGIPQLAINGNNVGIGTTSPTSILHIAASSPTFTVERTGISTVTLNNSGSVWTWGSSAATANHFAFAPGGTEAMRIVNGGNVGIGTTSPASRLEIVGDLRTSTGGGTANLFVDVNSAALAQIGLNGDIASKNNEFQLRTSGTPLAFYTGSTLGVETETGNARMVITNAGNVGIGTTTPAWRLQVAGTRPDFAISDSAGGTNAKHMLLSNRSGNLYIGTSTDVYATSTTPILTLLNNGNVGIGTSSPTTLLSLNGTGVANGITFGGDPSANLYRSGLSQLTTNGSIYATTNVGAGNSFYFYNSNLLMYSTTAIGDTGNAYTFADASGVNLRQIKASSLYIATTTTASPFLVTTSAGNVGVGTASPLSKLDVNGVISSATEYRFNNYSYSRIASVDSGGGYGGGYNFNWNNTSPQNDSTGTLSGYGFSQGSIRFFTNTSQTAGTPAPERMRIDSSGNVGIGTTSPWGLLSVNANGLSSGVPQFVVGSSTATNFIVANNGNTGIRTLTNISGADLNITTDNSDGNSDLRITLGNAVSGNTNGNRMTIQTGNGIGSGLGGNFEVTGGNGGATGSGGEFILGGGQGGSTSGAGGQVTISGGQAVNGVGGNVFITGGVGSGGTNAGGDVRINAGSGVVAGIVRSTSKWAIGTSTASSASNLTLNSTSATQLSLSAGAGRAQWTFRNAGENLYVGTTTVAGTATTTTSALTIIGASGNTGIASTTPWRTLSVNGTMAINGLTAAGVGDVFVCIDPTTFEVHSGATCAASTIKVKENRTNIKSALETLLKLKPVTFNYQKEYYNGKQAIGFIAEEVNAIDSRFAEHSTEDVKLPNGQEIKVGDPVALDTNAILSVTVKAVQELAERTTQAKETATNNYQWIVIGIMACWIIRLEFKKK